VSRREMLGKLNINEEVRLFGKEGRRR